jgi:O-antigen/teichoic acid export membrane protein
MARSLVTNSLLVYGQRFTTAFITLFSTPIILKNLGVGDYGIYTLTIGLVAVFNFVNWSLTSATQRFIAVALGEDSMGKLKAVFTNCFYIHLAYALTLMLIIGSLGLFFTETVLEIPLERVSATKKVLLFVALITFFEMLSVPFQGLLKAHEKFEIVAVSGVLSSLLKLGAAFLLFTAPIDKLIYLAILMSGSSALVFLFILIFSLRKFDFLRFNFRLIQRESIKEIFAFISWNMIGALALLGRNQGVALVLNIFFGVLANAAYGVALQVQASLGMLSQGIIAALNPRIMKMAGERNYQKMLYYSGAASRFGILALSFLAIPLFLNMPIILELWLDEVPHDASVYSRLIILFILTTGLSAGIQTVFQSINKVKAYNIYVSLIILLNIPIGVLLFYLNFPSYAIFVVSIVLEFFAFIVRLLLLKRYLEFSIGVYLKSTLVQVALPLFLSFGFAFGYLQLYEFGKLVNVLTCSLIGIVVLLLSIIVFSIDPEERLLVNKMLKNVFKL